MSRFVRIGNEIWERQGLSEERVCTCEGGGRAEAVLQAMQDTYDIAVNPVRPHRPECPKLYGQPCNCDLAERQEGASNVGANPGDRTTALDIARTTKTSTDLIFAIVSEFGGEINREAADNIAERVSINPRHESPKTHSIMELEGLGAEMLDPIIECPNCYGRSYTISTEGEKSPCEVCKAKGSVAIRRPHPWRQGVEHGDPNHLDDIAEVFENWNGLTSADRPFIRRLIECLRECSYGSRDRP